MNMTTVRFMFYNAYGVGGIGRTSFNFANYLVETKKYNVEIISIRRTSDKTTFQLNSKVKISVIQDARRGVNYTPEERYLQSQPSQLINPAEDQYPMFNAYTDMRIKDVLTKLRGGVLITTMTSLNAISVDIVDPSVLKIGQVHTEYSNHPIELQILMREYFPHLDALTILLESNRREYTRITQNKTPVYLLPNGTEIPPFQASLKNHVIIAAGRYVDIKGYDNLIRAFALVSKRFPDWTLKIYGWGDANFYQKVISEYEVGDQVVLEPGTDVIMEKYSEAAFLVCSSKAEGLSMTILEAMSLGLPCVSFMCGGPTEMITDCYDGFLVQKENVKALSEAMERMMTDEKLRIEMGKHARETVIKRYNINKLGAELDTIIAKELDRKVKTKNNANNQVAHDLDKQNAQKEIIRSSDDNTITDYSQIIDLASNGKIGLRSILKMIRGWLFYKLFRKK